MEEKAVFDAIFNFYNGLVLFGGGAIALWFSLTYVKTKSRPLLTSLPGIFTSLGLLGTFLSIVISLGGIRSSDFSMNEKTASIEIQNTEESSKITEEAIDAENGLIIAREANAKPSGNDKTIEIISGLVPAFTSSICKRRCND